MEEIEVAPFIVTRDKHDQQQSRGLSTTKWPLFIPIDAAASRACQFPAAVTMPGSEGAMMISAKLLSDTSRMEPSDCAVA